MKLILFITVLFVINTSFVQKTDPTVSPFKILREVNYKDFTFWWESTATFERVDLRYSFDDITYTTFHSSTDLNGTFSTRFSFKAFTHFRAVGILSGQEYPSGVISLQVGHGNNNP